MEEIMNRFNIVSNSLINQKNDNDDEDDNEKAEEEPENEDYPRDMVLANGKTFLQIFGPRGVMHTWATKVDDPTVDQRFGRVGKQRIEDTGLLTKKRMETIDDETGKAKSLVRITEVNGEFQGLL